MTEAVILALIALVGVLVLSITSIILVKILNEGKPSMFKFSTEHGNLELRFDPKADE